MSNFESMKQKAKQLRETLNKILEIDREELYGEKRLHDISFKHHGKLQFEMVFGLIEDLSKCHFDRIPENFIYPIQVELEIYKGIFERAKNLTLQDDSNSPKQLRDQIVQEIEENYSKLFSATANVISFANQAGADFKQIERELSQTLESAKTQVEEKNKQIEKNLQEANSLLEAMRTASAEMGVSQNSIHYSHAQKYHAKHAKKWYKWGTRLLVTLIIAVLGAGVIFLCFKDTHSPELGYLEIAVLAVFSLWVYAINFCNKNFHSEKHNEMINANKARTLTTFRSFVEATDDTSIKDQVLLHASTSAFSNPTTGFGKSQSPPISPAIELIKQASK